MCLCVARKRSEKRAEALKLWLQHGRDVKLKDLAKEVGVSAEQIRKWKFDDKWDEIPETVPNKRGAPFRNKNAIGNKGGGAPIGNENALKHGLYAKWLPDDDELQEIYQTVRDGMSMLDILYEDILVSFTNYIRAQKIMYVSDIDDTTKEVKKQKSYSNDKESSEEIEYEIQFAWDKQAKVLSSQAAASRSLLSKIKQYEEMIRTLPPEEVKESHRLRIEKMKADIKAVEAKAW